MTNQQLLRPPHGSDAVIRSFTAPRPLVDALRAYADEHGQSMSYVIRKALLDAGIAPPDEATS